MRIQKRVVDIYHDDYMRLIEDLKQMDKNKRMELYTLHSKMLFPKSRMIVNLEDQIKGNRDYIHKFKKSFLVIGNEFFSTNRFGEYNQELFIKKTGYKSQRYPQKVILALSMMGFIKGLKCNYSSSNHGYIYDIDYPKYRGWDQDITYVETPVDELTLSDQSNLYDQPIICTCESTKTQSWSREWTDTEREWLAEKQLYTIDSISIDEGVFRTLKEKRDDYLYNPSTKTIELQKELNHIYDLESIHYKTDASIRTKTDGEKGRFYTVMTRLKSDYRVNGTLHINGERFCEVDVSNAQPALLGLILKEKHPDIHSQWLEHCLAGDFYEWITDITGMEEYSVEDITNELTKIVYAVSMSGNENRALKHKIENNLKLVDKVSEIGKECKEKHHLFRPVVKSWIMNILFSKFRMTSTEKDGNTIYKHFCNRLCTYLKENEPCLYELLSWYRSKENHIPKKRNPDKTTSALPLKLQQEEVRYIKECLKRLDPEIDYLYTVHDCIGVLESDAKRVKEVMEQVSLDMYGVKLNLKIEGK